MYGKCVCACIIIHGNECLIITYISKYMRVMSNGPFCIFFSSKDFINHCVCVCVYTCIHSFIRMIHTYIHEYGYTHTHIFDTYIHMHVNLTCYLSLCSHDRFVSLHQLRVLPDWAGSERVRGTFPGILRVLRSLPSRPESHRVCPRRRGKLRGVPRRQIQDSHGDSSVRPMRGCSSVPARVLPNQLWRRLSRDLRRVRRLRGWRVPDRVRLALARTMHYMSARHVQDQRRIRALRDVRARLHSWQTPERMQLKFRGTAVY